MGKDVLVISDIHGRGNELKLIIEKIKNRLDEFKIILLGDYIGYGKSNLEVIKMLKFLKENSDCVILKGNWEDMFYTYLRNKKSEDDIDLLKIQSFRERGGIDVKRELFEDKKMLNYYMNLIEKMPLIHTEMINKELFLFAHSGIDLFKNDTNSETWRDLINSQDEQDLLWNFNFYNNMKENSSLLESLTFKIVSGHVPTQVLDKSNNSGIYNLKDKILGVDFGASRKNGKLGLVNLSKEKFPICYQNVL